MAVKVFISQPMQGRSDTEIENEREQIIRNFRKSFAVINTSEPVFLDSYFEDYEPTVGNQELKCLAKSIELLADADIAVFAKGWEKARGCKIEHECAVSYGIEVVHLA